MPVIAVSYKMIALWFALVCLILSAFLLIWPNVFKAANRVSKKWVSTDAIEKALNRTHDIDDKLLGMRKIMGVILLLLAVIFILILFR
ncbi:MAG: hypothetical protein ABIH24_03665 [Verrucomicrobiota bacterium]